jgi:cytochrome c biogenesis protein CcdA
VLVIVLAFLRGVFTILSPCILPVVPVVFARSDRPFFTGRLPLLIGLAASYAVVTGIGVAGLSGAEQLSHYGRWIPLGLLALVGLSLLLPAIATRLTQPPLTNLGNRLPALSDNGSGRGQAVSTQLLGLATGMLWAPRAGPFPGAILAGAALHGTSWQTGAGLAAYAIGAASSLAVVSSLQSQLMNRLNRSAGWGEHLRRAARSDRHAGRGHDRDRIPGAALAHVPCASRNRVESRLVKLLAPTQART